MRELVLEIDVISFNRTNTRSDIRVAVGVPTVTNYDVRLVSSGLWFFLPFHLAFPLVPATRVEEEAEKKKEYFVLACSRLAKT